MRTLILPLAMALSLTTSALAEPQKRQVYGPFQLGVSKEESNKQMDQFMVNYSRRPSPTTAVDVSKGFVTKGTKYPPKLSAKYSKTRVQLIMSVEDTAESLSFISTKDPFTEQHDVKGGWEVFRDIAESKFGKPIEAAAFPDLSQLTSAITPTHRWKLDDLEIVLGVQLFSHLGNTAEPTAILTAKLP